MSLKNYKKKRDFKKTPEPKSNDSGKKNLFVIQKHDATNLHYDFRLAINGVLKSWAVPKGPSTNPEDKRLAIMTEDHPMSYADFEGRIPEGQYGAGVVIIWDKGVYENLSDKSMSEGLKKGHLKFKLTGNKLKGGYSLYRFKKEDNQWLLVKMNDEEADARRNPTSTEPESVKTGKKVEDYE